MDDERSACHQPRNFDESKADGGYRIPRASGVLNQLAPFLHPPQDHYNITMKSFFASLAAVASLAVAVSAQTFTINSMYVSPKLSHFETPDGIVIVQPERRCLRTYPDYMDRRTT